MKVIVTHSNLSMIQVRACCMRNTHIRSMLIDSLFLRATNDGDSFLSYATEEDHEGGSVRLNVRKLCRRSFRSPV